MDMAQSPVKPVIGRSDNRTAAASKENKVRSSPRQENDKKRNLDVDAGTITRELQKARKSADRYTLAIKTELIDSLFASNKSVRTTTIDLIEDAVRRKSMEKLALKEEHKAALGSLGLMTILIFRPRSTGRNSSSHNC